MKRLQLTFLAIMLVAGPAAGQGESAGEINKKIDGIVDDIVTAYRQLESAKYRNTLAVLAFDEMSEEAKRKKIGFGASELLETRLAQTGLFKVVERDKIDQVAAEIALGQTGMIEESGAAKAGKMLGADIIVTGSISELGAYFNINVRLTEVETGRNLAAAAAEIAKEDFLARIRYVEPKRYRIDLGYAYYSYGDIVPYYTDDETYGQLVKGDMRTFITAGFTWEFSERFFWDIQAGVSFEDRYAYSGAQPHPASYIRDGLAVMLDTRINCWLWNAGTIGAAAFTGAGLVLRDLEYAHFLGNTEIYQDKSEPRNSLFPAAPVGVSLYLYQQAMVSLRIDAGYQFAQKVIWEYPLETVNKPDPITMDPGGLILGGKVRLYF